jgi:hypothetical protein
MSRGMSLSATLGVVFIILKLVGVISWSWLWVLCPFWFGGAIIISIALTAITLAGLHNLKHKNK